MLGKLKNDKGVKFCWNDKRGGGLETFIRINEVLVMGSGRNLDWGENGEWGGKINGVNMFVWKEVGKK